MGDSSVSCDENGHNLLFSSSSDVGSGNSKHSSKVSSFFVMGDSSVSCGDGGHNPFYSLLRPNTSLFPCNGPQTRLLPDFLAEKMGLPRIPAFHADNGTIEGLENGINFGSTQATILSSGRLGFQGLNQQLRQAYETLQLLQLQLGRDKAQQVIESSVFYLSLGKDDYSNFLHPDSSGVRHRFSKEVFTHILVNQMIRVVKDLYNANVKKIVCMGIGPLGCAPRTLWESSRDNDSHYPTHTLSNSGAGSGWQDCMKDVNDLVLEYSSLLSERLLDLNFEFPDAQIIFCDVYQAMMDIISFPRRYAEKMGLPRIPAFHADNGTIEGLENGINFGSKQATILSSGRLGFQGLNQQLRQAYETLQLLQLQLGQDKSQQVIESSVFYLSLGKDDYSNFLHPDSSGVRHRFSKEVFTQILVNQMIRVVKDLYNANVKKIVCMGIGPLGCAPRTLWESSRDNDSHHTTHTSSNSGAGSGWQDCMEDVNDLVLEYSSLLSERLLDLNFEFPDAQIIFCDMWYLLLPLLLLLRSSTEALLVSSSTSSFASSLISADKNQYGFHNNPEFNQQINTWVTSSKDDRFNEYASYRSSVNHEIVEEEEEEEEEEEKIMPLTRSSRGSTGFENVNRSFCGTGRYGGILGCQAIEMACDQPLTHVWWDFHNPTQAVHSLLAQSAWSSKPLDICRPISIERLSVLYLV